MEEVEKKTKKEIIAELMQQIKELEAKLKSAEGAKYLWHKESQEKSKIIEEMHSVFDGIEGCQARFVEQKQQYGGRSEIELSLQARLVSFMQTLIK
jgi:hypothetical protein